MTTDPIRSDPHHSLGDVVARLPNLIPPERTLEEQYLRQTFVRAQMKQFAREPFVVARADGVYDWDVSGTRYLDGIAGIYVASVGHNNPRVIEASQRQLEVLTVNPAMHGTNPLAIQLAKKTDSSSSRPATSAPPSSSVAAPRRLKARSRWLASSTSSPGTPPNTR